MNRRIRKIIFALVVAALLGAVVWFALRAPHRIHVGTAVVSKTLCSGVFISGLDPDMLYAEAVKPIPGQSLLAKHLRIDVDRNTKQVSATWRHAFESRAVYREGFGCRLVHEDEPQGRWSGSSTAGAPRKGPPILRCK
jgi:hypothetical protein